MGGLQMQDFSLNSIIGKEGRRFNRRFIGVCSECRFLDEGCFYRIRIQFHIVCLFQFWPGSPHPHISFSILTHKVWTACRLLR